MFYYYSSLKSLLSQNHLIHANLHLTLEIRKLMQGKIMGSITSLCYLWGLMFGHWVIALMVDVNLVTNFSFIRL